MMGGYICGVKGLGEFKRVWEDQGGSKRVQEGPEGSGRFQKGHERFVMTQEDLEGSCRSRG